MHVYAPAFPKLLNATGFWMDVIWYVASCILFGNIDTKTMFLGDHNAPMYHLRCAFSCSTTCADWLMTIIVDGPYTLHHSLVYHALMRISRFVILRKQDL